MTDSVYITGTGIVSAIGMDCNETVQSLKQSKSGINKISHLDTVYKDEIPAAEVNATDQELLKVAGVNGKDRFSRTTLLGLIAAGQALKEAGINEMSDYPTGIVSATTVGGMDRSEKFYKEFLKNNKRGRLRDIITHDCADSTEKIADILGIRDYVTTISTACSSSANAILYGARLIKNGMLDRVLVGGTDSLTLFTINGFNSLMILDREPCKPFDDNRNGLNLGEGSGFLLLESSRIVEKEKRKALCEVKGYGNTCDAYHQTASSPEGNGAFASMKKALDVAQLEPGMIDYINAHGTGTQNNDLSEGRAIERLFGDAIPAVSSTKPFTGHTLGAAGAIEAVLSVLAIKYQWIYPNLNFKHQMKELHFTPVTEFRQNAKIQHILSNSFGFGGNNTSVIFSKC